MALPHAQPLDIINVAPLGDKLRDSVSTSLIKTDEIQLLHLVLAEHQDQPFRHVDHACTIHCLEGDVEVVMGAGTRRIRAGQLLVLPAKQEHSLRARAASAVLLTLLLERGDAARQGGRGNERLEEATQAAAKLGA